MNSNSRRLFIAGVLFLLALPVRAQQRDFTRYVDPFIGTGGHGHTFPGAALPFGMVQLSPDTRLAGWDGCSGYHYSDSIIYGFSHTHLSGTGISDYGDVLFMPTAGPVFLNALNGKSTNQGYASRFSHQNEKASPGYYSVRLDDENILVELTATTRAGLHRYTYPRTAEANIVIDLTHRDNVLESSLTFVGNNRVVGFRRSNAWANDQIVFFAAEFSQPFTTAALAIDDRLANNSRTASGHNVKGYVRFDARSGNPVMVRIGISAVSIEGALRNLDTEIDQWDFEKTKAKAQASWNRELSKISVTGGTVAQLKTFYTALYHTMLAPNLFMDVDGQYRGRDFKIHKADFNYYTVFSLWDTFRAAHPLYTLIDQRRTTDFIRTFLAQYDDGGALPVWELAANETDTMIGYHAVSVIADAAVKGVRGFDLQKAFTAMKHSAELNNHGLGAYRSKGFVEVEDDRESVSKTLEYAYDDWCIAQVAQLLGYKDESDKYLRRGQSFENVFDRETGFMRPRTNGGWSNPFDPREVNSSFTEANSWQYSFFAPQDIERLTQLLGGKTQLASKLDQLFTADSRTTGRDQADITGLIGQYAHGNEPSHHVAYLYNYAGQPWKTQQRVRQIMDQLYLPTPDGLSGNEDCGQMSAWYVLSAAGFYPVTPGSTTYAIGTPIFPEARFKLENGKTFVIKAHHVSSRNIFIQSAKLNGQPYQKSYLDHAQLIAGGVLEFEMGPQPNESWGSGSGNEPVSRIEGSAIVPAPVLITIGKSFKEATKVGISVSDRSAEIYYTTDNSDPDKNSQRFAAPFQINQTTTVRAIAVRADGEQSQVISATYQKIVHDWTITLGSKYSNQYSGGGDVALIDGIRGTSNWSSGAWQGYQGTDLVAVIDLKRVQKISKLGAGFLQDAGSWIWMPRSVQFEVSLDGKTYVPIVSIPNDVPDGSSRAQSVGVVAKDFVREIPETAARFVRVRAVSFGKIPSWHPGAGGDAWIFADEIIIE